MEITHFLDKIETSIKLNLTIINLISNVVVNVTRKWKEKMCYTCFFFNLFGLGKLLLFFKITFFITDSALLILKIFNDKADITMFLIRKLLFSLMHFYL